MLYVFSGSDFAKVKQRVSHVTKGYEVVRFGEGGEPFSSAPGRVGASSLFSSKVALYFDRPLDDAEGREMFLGHAKVFAEADMPVVAVVTVVDAETKKKLPKGASVELFDTQNSDVSPTKVFALTDAFARGDRKGAWVLYRKFVESGSSAEELFGMLAWQVRAIALASKAASAEAAGLKPFVYTKAKSALHKLNTNPDTLSRELVALYHQSRMGHGNLENLLEVFLLKKN